MFIISDAVFLFVDCSIFRSLMEKENYFINPTV